jgi:hypothetical protein
MELIDGEVLGKSRRRKQTETKDKAEKGKY